MSKLWLRESIAEGVHPPNKPIATTLGRAYPSDNPMDCRLTSDDADDVFANMALR